MKNVILAAACSLIIMASSKEGDGASGSPDKEEFSKTVTGTNSDGEKVEVYEPDRGTQDAPAVSQADMDTAQKPAAKLADGSEQNPTNYRRQAASADGPAPSGAKVNDGKASDPEDTIEATEAAEKLAKENGIDLSTVTGTGSNGSITKADVQKAIDEKAAA